MEIPPAHRFLAGGDRVGDEGSGAGVWRGGGRPEDVEVGIALNEHFGAADDVNGEEVGCAGLDFGEALLFDLQGLVLAIESDTKFVWSGGKRAVKVEWFSRPSDGEARSGEELLVYEDGEGCAVDSGRDFYGEGRRGCAS